MQFKKKPGHPEIALLLAAKQGVTEYVGNT